MYKDPDRQREANAERQRRYKAKHKGVTSEGVTDKALPDITECDKQGVVDCDWPICTCDEPGKRGKDIKYFGDLPVDVQETINKMSFVDGKFSETIKANRTAIAVNYQHQFPDRFHSTGVN